MTLHCSVLRCSVLCCAAAGLSSGLLLRTEVDKVTGQLSDTRTRFLGTRAPRLFGVPLR